MIDSRVWGRDSAGIVQDQIHDAGEGVVVRRHAPPGSAGEALVRRARRGSVRSVSVALYAALVTSACSSGVGGDAAPSGAAPDSEVAQQAAQVSALDQAGRDKLLQETASAVEHQMLVLSGLADELGGEKQAVAAYDAMAQQFVAAAQRFSSTPPTFGKMSGAAIRANAGSSSLGAMLFGGLIVGAMLPEAIVGGSNDIEPGAEPEHSVNTDKSGDSSMESTIDATTSTASADMTMQTTGDGINGKIRVQMTINPCPGPDGTFTATATITMSSTSASGSYKGSNLKVDLKVTGHVDDDAQLVGHETETTTESADFGNGDNKWVQVKDSLAYTGSTMTGATRTIPRSAGKATAEFARGVGMLGLLTSISVEGKLLAAAQKGWESGRCVRLDTTTEPAKRTGLSPSTSVTITAAPRSKLDGAKTGGTVTGKLSGESSLDPSGSKVPADATFTYVAPSTVGQGASVALEARSKRGVGKAELAFNTMPSAYDVTGWLASAPSGTTFTGRICDVQKPFTVTTAGDQVGTITFTPTSATAGTLVFKGRVGNAPLAMKATGTYTIAAPPDSASTGTLTLTWRVTIVIPVVGNQTRSGTVPLTLTPRSAC